MVVPVALALFLWMPVLSHAQDSTDIESGDLTQTVENIAPEEADASKTKKSRGKGSLIESRFSDALKPGWTPRRATTGLGYSTSFLSGANTFIFEKLKPNTSWSIFFGLTKAANSYSDSSKTATSGTGPVTTTTTTTYSGVRQPYTISLGYSYNWHMVRNDWIMVRAGVFGGMDYFTKTDYKTGSRSESYSSTTPTTVTVSETLFGEVKSSRDPIFKLGPVVDTFVFIRWLPQLAVGLQGGILYSTDVDSSQKTSVRTRTYQRINGVDQTPISDDGSTTNLRTRGGPSITTFTVNGTTFNLFGNFVLRYIW